MNPVLVRIRRLPGCEDLPLPSRQTDHSAGLDLLAAEEAVLEPGGRASVGTGIAIALPPGFEAQIRPRSGIAARHGVTLLNTPGTVDADYRGEVRVLLINLGQDPFRVTRGDRIAQMVIAPVQLTDWAEVQVLPESGRGEGGFGSTGGICAS